VAWKLRGTYFETCSCDLVCPCAVSLSLSAHNDRCNVTLVFRSSKARSREPRSAA
jgi:hypothetical protein